MPVRRCGRTRRMLRRGGALTLIALLLPVLVLLAGFAVNFAYMDLIRTETFVAADAATRAGGRTFALTGDLDMVKLRAREAARRNPVAGRPLTLADADFVLGRSVRRGNPAGR